MNNNKTAILIFARSAQADASQKKLGKSVALFKELNRQTLITAKATGLPYFQCSEKEQVGADFGERLTNALSDVYELGFDNVIAIGNDTPQLLPSHILSAHNRLQSTSLVLGPSSDGGFYLMGLRRSHFRPEQFVKLPWQSENLTDAILSSLSRKRINTLETLSDLDTIADLEYVVGQRAPLNRRILQLINNLFTQTKIVVWETAIHFFSSLTKRHFNKGSPKFIHI